jgi:hypothetical protein
MFRTVLKNLYNKTSFQATDLNYEINLFRFLIFLMQTIQTTSAGQRRDAPSLLTVQSQALNL